MPEVKVFGQLKEKLLSVGRDLFVPPMRPVIEIYSEEELSEENRRIDLLMKAVEDSVVIVSTYSDPVTRVEYKRARLYRDVLRERSQFRGLDSY